MTGVAPELQTGDRRLPIYPVLALGLLVLTDQFSGQAMAVLAPDITKSLGITTAALASTFAVQLVALGAAPFLMAAVLRGRAIRATISIGTGFVWSACTVAIAFADNLFVLAGLLVISGLANGSVIALHTPLLVDTYPPTLRGRAITLYGAAAPTASVLGPLVVAGLTGWLGLDWRAVFITLGIASAIGCLFASRLRDPGIGRHVDADADAEPGRGSTRAAFRALLRIPTFRRILAGFAAYGMLLVPGSTYLAVHLEQRWGMQADARGLFLATCSTAVIVLLVLFGGKLDPLFRAGPGRVAIATAVLLTLSAVGVTVGVLVQVQVLTLAFFMLTLVSTGCVVPLIYLVVLSVSAPSDRSHATSIGAFALAFGGVLGAGLLSAVDNAFGTAGAIASIAVPGLVSGIIIATAARTIRRDLYRPDAPPEVEELLMTSVFGEPGHATTADGRRLHFVSQGSGEAVVVFESGMGASRTEWGLVLPAVAAHTRAVAYDRAGLGRSPFDRARRDLDRMAADLGALLDHLGAERYVLVAHSLGGPIVRTYAMAHPERIAGLVLVDQSTEGLDIMYARGRNTVARAMLAGMHGMARVGVRYLPAEMRRVMELFPPDMRAEMEPEHTSAATVRATRAEFAALPDGFRKLRDTGTAAALPPVPITLISGAGGGSAKEIAMRVPFVAEHRKLAEELPHGRHVLAERTGHMVPQDRPDVVIEEILAVVRGTP